MNLFKTALLFTAFGCFFEVFFTSIYDYIEAKVLKRKADIRLFGYWSLHYILLYTILLPIFWLIVIVPYYFNLSVVLRLLLYGLTFQVGEYIGMYIIKKTYGVTPSESNYANKFDSVHNLTRLSYFPIFAFEGFCFEIIYKLFL